MASLNTSIEARIDRLRRIYAGEPSKLVYDVKSVDDALWHREQDERALARQYIADLDNMASPPVAPSPDPEVVLAPEIGGESGT